MHQEKGIKQPDKPRSESSRCICGLLILSFMVAVGLAAALTVVIVKHNKEEDTTQDICVTPGCAAAAARVLEAVDDTANPCDDFYQFACGKWVKKHIIPEDKSSMDVWTIIRDYVDVTNKYLLEDPVTRPNATAIQEAKDLYLSCINLELANQKDIDPTIPLLNELGGWPVLGNKPGGHWNESEFDMTEVITTLRKYNNKVIVDMAVTIDIKNSTQFIIEFDQQSLGMASRDYYLEIRYANIKDAYTTMATNIAIAFGADPNVAVEDIRKAIELETDLANISMPSAARRNSDELYNKMTVADMASRFPEPKSSDNIQFKWSEIVQSQFSIEGVNVEVNNTEPVLVADLQYYTELSRVLQKYSKRTIANYLVWRIMQNRARNLSQRLKDILDEYSKAVYGYNQPSPRWQSCIGYTVLMMPHAVGNMFVKEAFDETAKEVALDMIHGIRDAFTDILMEQTWMDAETKKAAHEKAEAMREWIGYPSDILDEGILNSIYENITYDPKEYFQNVLSNLQRWGIGDLQGLRETYSKNSWGEPPSDVNAQYSFQLNTIQFPAGIFQPPFYQKDMPRSMNYGGIGVIIGHEITHGYDDQGRKYDKEGNLKNWWDTSILQNFKNRAQCIVDQYGNFDMPEVKLNVDGENTLGENIADNGGLKESFRAYRNWVDSVGKEEPLLPGVSYNNNQLFFLNFAQNWCSNDSPEALLYSVKSDPHSPAKFRVIGTLQNSQDFANTFNCPAGTFMNPVHKCSVWKKK